MVKECIILAGGWGKRLKPQIEEPKPLVQLNNTTLLGRQISWLEKYGFDRVIIPSKEFNLTSHPVVWVEEKERLGTGGAVKLANKEVLGNRVYVMNVDDIVFYNPNILWKESHLGAAILVGKLRSPYGIITSDKAGNVLKFEEKPLLPYDISLGHYCFKKEVIEQYFPDKGDLELQLMQILADNKLLRIYEYKDAWISINTYKDLEKAREYFKRKGIE